MLLLSSARHEQEGLASRHRQDQPVAPKGACNGNGGKATPLPGVFVGVVHPAHQGPVLDEPLKRTSPDQAGMIFRGGTW